MWRKRRRYVFRKRSMGGRTLRLVIGISVVLGVIWLVPWPTLSSEAVDEPKVDTSEARPDQTAMNEQSEQETARDRPKGEDAPNDAPPPEEERASSNPLPTSSPTPQPTSSPTPQPPSSPPAQASLPSPPPSPPPRMEEISNSFLPPNDYRDYNYRDYNYWNDDYYWDYEPDYWDYEPDYWDYSPDY